MKVKELMTGGVCSVKPETSLEEVAKQMRKIDTGVIPVCNDKEEILGIITDRDIVIRYLGSGREIYSAGEIMSQNVISVPQDLNIHDAALLLSHYKIRRLPDFRKPPCRYSFYF